MDPICQALKHDIISGELPELRVTLHSGLGMLSYQAASPWVQINLQDGMPRRFSEHTFKNEADGLQSRHEKVLGKSWVVSWRRSPEMIQGPAAWQASHRRKRGYWVASV